MDTIEKQEEWELVKIKGEFYAVTLDENRRLLKLNLQYGGHSKAPDSELFTGFALTKNGKGHLYCDGNLDMQFKVNELEFYLIPIIKP